MDVKESLRCYQMLKRSFFGESYLFNFNVNNFGGARLKCMARTGCLGLGEDLERWGIPDGKYLYVKMLKKISHIFYFSAHHEMMWLVAIVKDTL